MEPTIYCILLDTLERKLPRVFNWNTRAAGCHRSTFKDFTSFQWQIPNIHAFEHFHGFPLGKIQQKRQSFSTGEILLFLLTFGVRRFQCLLPLTPSVLLCHHLCSVGDVCLPEPLCSSCLPSPSSSRMFLTSRHISSEYVFVLMKHDVLMSVSEVVRQEDTPPPPPPLLFEACESTSRPAGSRHSFFTEPPLVTFKTTKLQRGAPRFLP